MRNGILTLFLILGVFSASAKQDNMVLLNNPVASLKDGLIHVSFEGSIDKHASGHNYETVVTPFLKNGADSIELPAIVAQSRHTRILMKRQQTAGEFIPVASDIVYVNKGDLFLYNVSIPYEKWMNHSDLIISSYEKGCCKLELMAKKIMMSDIVFERPQMIEPVKIIPVITTETRTESFQIQFKLAEAKVLRDFGNNAVELERIDQVIKGQNDKESVTLIKEIIITGHVSPEGDYTFNYNLAQRRADALKDYIINEYPNISSGLISTKNGLIDWRYLVELLERSDLSNRQEVIDLIQNTYPQSDIETKIQKLDGGKTYRFLLNNIYPVMRIDSAVKIYLIKK